MHCFGTIRLFSCINGLSIRNSHSVGVRGLEIIKDKIVLISRSKDIFLNLSLEDWIYSNSRIYEGASVLLLWVDTPCAVIGRHQNPWVELDVKKCLKHGISVSRRNSGGGTVYHDPGNLNLSFITTKKNYCRKLNLTFISDFLADKFNVNCAISPREDLLLQPHGLKVSGTASKLSSKNAYHHCTLLVDSNLNLMREIIRKTPPENIISNATSSTKSSVANLKNCSSSISIDNVMDAISSEYSTKILTVDPIESIDELNKTYETFKSWEWVFGRTPKFSARYTFNGGYLDVIVSKGYLESATFTVDGKSSNIEVPKIQFDEEEMSGLVKSLVIKQLFNTYFLLIFVTLFLVS